MRTSQREEGRESGERHGEGWRRYSERPCPPLQLRCDSQAHHTQAMRVVAFTKSATALTRREYVHSAEVGEGSMAAAVLPPEKVSFVKRKHA